MSFFAPDSATRDLGPHNGGDLGAEQLDGLHHLGVGHGPHPELQQQALVAKEAVLEKGLLNNLCLLYTSRCV